MCATALCKTGHAIKQSRLESVIRAQRDERKNEILHFNERLQMKRDAISFSD